MASTDDMTPAEERADYIRTVCADRGITLHPGFLGHPGTWCAETWRGESLFHACGDGPDGYEAMGNLLEQLAFRAAL